MKSLVIMVIFGVMPILAMEKGAEVIPPIKKFEQCITNCKRNHSVYWMGASYYFETPQSANHCRTICTRGDARPEKCLKPIK